MAILATYRSSQGVYSISLACTACSGSDGLGTYSSAADAWEAAQRHRCTVPVVTISPGWQRFGGQPVVEVEHRGSFQRYTYSEAQALLASLAGAISKFDAEQHAKDTAATIADLDARARAEFVR